LLLGRTRSGKTTLKDRLREIWLQTHTHKSKRARALIVDSKPRYRAQWTPQGFSASRFYRKWKEDPEGKAYVPGSVRIPLDGHWKASMDLAWRMGANTCIIQGKLQDWDAMLDCVRVFYEEYSARSGPRMIDVDELADFFEVKKIGGIFWQALRSGGELDVSVLAGSQRPAFITKATLTESDRLYVFELDNEDDVKSLVRQAGYRPGLVPERPHEFIYYDKYHRDFPSGGLFKLDMKG
jgi:hypothetical protein